MFKSYSIAEARDRFAALIRKVEKDTPVELTRRGKPVAVIMSIQHYQQLQAGKRGFWQAYESFRSRYDLQSLDIQPEIFSDVRDAEPGREVDL
ncbi:MAG: type II toxin-antitoxin system Phd/YefM family antitoxin [Chloroflexota bacterium]|nr:MAG: type II toxin-antitoxin system Phd/YefM family antitoxin [Chloroflexota bacterium]